MRAARSAALQIVAATAVAAHPDPSNLAELDCAVSAFAAEFGAGLFPNDPAGVGHALHAAFHLPACPQHSGQPYAASPPPRQSHGGGGYSAALPGPQPGGATTSIYVAPTTGSDSTGDGSITKPFASIHRAQLAVRVTPRSQRPPTTVFLRAGTHYLGHTLTLTPEDGGRDAATPVVYSAYPGEAVTVSGGIPLGTSQSPLTWMPLATSGNGSAFKAVLPAGAPLNFSTLFVDGERAIWARFPNGNNKDITGMCFSKAQRPIETAHPCNGYAQATGTVVPRPSPKVGWARSKQSVGRFGLYPDFDIMTGGTGQPTDPHAHTYTYADLFDAPGGMCLKAGLSPGHPALRSPPALNCTPAHQCTVPCGTPGSVKWFGHYDRMQGQTDTFSFDKQTWSQHSWDHPERGVVRFLGQPDWGSHTYPIRAMDAAKSTIQLGAGGWQFADIAAVKHGNRFYVEGIVEEVDASWEWAVQFDKRELHFFPNQTGSGGLPPGPAPPNPSPPSPPSPAVPPGAFYIYLTASDPAVSHCTLAGQTVPCCADLSNWNRSPNAKFALDNCHPHKSGSNQLFTSNASAAHGTYTQLKVVLDGMCFTASAGSVLSTPCGAANPHQLWKFLEDGQLQNKAGDCLSAKNSPATDGSGLFATKCSTSDPKQQFSRGTEQVELAGSLHADADTAGYTVRPPKLVEAAVLQRLVTVQGTSSSNPVQHISFRGVRFAHAATTQLEKYEVPSGGGARTRYFVPRCTPRIVID
jgi:hypothetical protein